MNGLFLFLCRRAVLLSCMPTIMPTVPVPRVFPPFIFMPIHALCYCFAGLICATYFGEKENVIVYRARDAA